MCSGFKEAKRKAIELLLRRSYFHETREDINQKNLLSTGEITPEKLADIIQKSSGNDHSMSDHHSKKFLVHVIKKDGWYIKFYFVEPNVVFISVHQ